MPTTLTTAAVERSTFAVVATFTDENGDSLTPTTLTWSLTDLSGTVINDREDVSITPAASVTIVLRGDDLALVNPLSPERVVTIEGTFTSDLGSDLPVRDQVLFTIANLIAVS